MNKRKANGNGSYYPKVKTQKAIDNLIPPDHWRQSTIDLFSLREKHGTKSVKSVDGMVDGVYLIPGEKAAFTTLFKDEKKITIPISFAEKFRAEFVKSLKEKNPFQIYLRHREGEIVWDLGMGFVLAIDDKFVTVVRYRQPLQPLRINLDGSITMWCYDITCDKLKEPGCVRLWGKKFVEDINDYKTICVLVRGVKRRLFVIPKKDLYNNPDPKEDDNIFIELEGKLSKLGINTRMIKPHIKMNCFDHLITSIPRTTYKVFEVMYLPPDEEYTIANKNENWKKNNTKNKTPRKINFTIDEKFEKGETYSAILGTGDDELHTFLIDTGVNGPCSLNIAGLSAVSPESIRTKCDYAFELSIPASEASIDCISVTEDSKPTPMKIVYMFPKRMNSGIIALSCATSTIDDPKIHMDNEMTDRYAEFFDNQLDAGKNWEPLRKLIEYIDRNDPDIICGHGINDFLYTTLYNINKEIPDSYKQGSGIWGVLGRKIVSGMNKNYQTRIASRNSLIRSVSQGRIFIDTMEYLLKRREKVDVDLLDEVSVNCQISDVINRYRDFVKKKAVIPITYYLSVTIGTTWSQSIWEPMSFHQEQLLYKLYYANWYLIPDKLRDCEYKAKVTGGYNMEVKPGVYKNLCALIDFQSYYPTIIIEKNICSTIYDRNMKYDNISTMETEEERKGLLAEAMSIFMGQRSKWKKDAKTEKSDITRQMLTTMAAVMKLLVNGVYGCMAQPSFRFYSPHLADFITTFGQQELRRWINEIRLIESPVGKFDIIMAVTDSLFIDLGTSDFSEVAKLISSIINTINSKYKIIEVKLENVFKVLIVYSRNHYVALSFTEPSDPVIKSYYLDLGLSQLSDPVVKKGFSEDCGQVLIDFQKSIFLDVLNGYNANSFGTKEREDAFLDSLKYGYFCEQDLIPSLKDVDKLIFYSKWSADDIVRSEIGEPSIPHELQKSSLINVIEQMTDVGINIPKSIEIPQIAVMKDGQPEIAYPVTLTDSCTVNGEYYMGKIQHFFNDYVTRIPYLGSKSNQDKQKKSTNAGNKTKEPSAETMNFIKKNLIDMIAYETPFKDYESFMNGFARSWEESFGASGGNST